MRILISVHPFAATGIEPLEKLRESGHELRFNPHGRKMTEAEILAMAPWADAIVAGTEPITEQVIEACPNLRVISRVGSGFDSVDRAACHRRGIKVCYAPNAPVPSVVELTLGLALDCLRRFGESDLRMRRGEWYRPMGRLLRGRVVGVAGVGRIGSRVAQTMQALGCEVRGHDIAPNPDLNIPYVSREVLLAESDIVTLHLPLSARTRHWIDAAALRSMKPGAILINAARGGIVDEAALEVALRERHLSCAAVDVFEREPYDGPLRQVGNVILTGHIGAAAAESRILMEYEAVENALLVLSGKEPLNEVPLDLLAG
ncbi:phosphoglycerate dehydrogenase [Radicibacter daui]|uniref:phosphoglycerate dehydrogenase n=1 Tax=Radicibacter daui TaxID=3064829 RepID=UPI004046AAD3